MVCARVCVRERMEEDVFHATYTSKRRSTLKWEKLMIQSEADNISISLASHCFWKIAIWMWSVCWNANTPAPHTHTHDTHRMKPGPAQQSIRWVHYYCRCDCCFWWFGFIALPFSRFQCLSFARAHTCVIAMRYKQQHQWQNQCAPMFPFQTIFQRNINSVRDTSI